MMLSTIVCVVIFGLTTGNLAVKYEYGKSHSIAKRDTCTAISTLNVGQKQILLDAHNHARHIVNPAPYEPLEDLTWDDGLASRAQELADSCRFAHDVLYDCAGGRMGQNLAWYGSSWNTPEDDLAGHVVRWDDEKTDYDFETNQCSAVCGHYTQLVWADTKKVGCGYKNCKRLYNIDGSLQQDFGQGSAWLLVCDYSPPGNYGGEKPYETEYIDPASLVDARGSECTQWIYQYCGDPVYGKWAEKECAKTCRQP